MRSLVSVLLVASLGLLAGCGEDTAGPEPGDEPTSGAQPADGDAPPAATLGLRDEPLEVGDVAPAFEGMPTADGPVVLLFFRGHW